MTVHLRPIHLGDLTRRSAWFRHEKLLGTMPLVGSFSAQDTEDWFMRVQVDDSRVDTVLAVEDRAVAAGGLTGLMGHRPVAELYAVVSPDHRGMGYGKRLVAGLCELAAETLSARRLYLWTYGTNVPAIRLYETCGFRLEGRLREHALVGGRRVDRVAMGLLDREWAGSKPWAAHTPEISHDFRYRGAP